MSEKLFTLFVAFIHATGYTGVVLLMAAQSACIPLPSEVIMPVAGFALAHSQWDLIVLATLASLASNLGSIPAYWVGARGGRPMVRALRKLPAALAHHDLDRVDAFFTRFGSLAVLIGRMLPIIRTFIAFPPGVAKMNQVKFHVYTFIGSWPWCYALAWVGMKLGDTFNTDPRFKAIFQRFHLAVEAGPPRRHHLVRRIPLEEPDSQRPGGLRFSSQDPGCKWCRRRRCDAWSEPALRTVSGHRSRSPSLHESAQTYPAYE